MPAIPQIRKVMTDNGISVNEIDLTGTPVRHGDLVLVSGVSSLREEYDALPAQVAEIDAKAGCLLVWPKYEDGTVETVSFPFGMITMISVTERKWPDSKPDQEIVFGAPETNVNNYERGRI